MERTFVVGFNELSEQKQQEVLRENSKEMWELAATSYSSAIRILVVTREETSSELLSKMLKKENNENVIIEIVTHKNFQRTPENIAILLHNLSSYSDLRIEIASWPELTKELITEILENKENDDMIRTIFERDDFQRTPKNLRILVNNQPNDPCLREEIVSWPEMTTELITEVLRNEEDEDVIETIIERDDFQRTAENLLILVHNIPYHSWLRRKIVRWPEMTAELLTSMLKKEDDDDVIATIMEHKNFERKPENLEILLDKVSSDADLREEIVRWPEMPLDLLEQMLETEEDEGVIKEIIKNINQQLIKS